MSGGEKAAQAESLAFRMNRCRGALLAGTALVAAPAFLALSLGPAQAGDLIINSGTYVNDDKLVVDDVRTGSSGRLINKGKLRADDVTNSGRIKNKGKLETDDLTNKKGGVILNKGTLTVDDDVKNSGRIVNDGTLTADTIINKQDGVIRNKIDGDLEADKIKNSGRIVNDGLLTADSLTNKNGGVIHNQSAGDLEVGKLRNSGSIVNDGFLTADRVTNKKGGVINNKSDGRLEAGDVTNSGRIVNDGALTADSVTNKKGGVIHNQSDGDFEAGDVTNSGRIVNDGTLTAGGITNNTGGVIVNNGTIIDTLTNFGTVTNNGSYKADANNIGAAALITNNGTWTGNLLSNTGTVTLSNGSSWTGNLTNNNGGTINLGTSSVLATNQLVTGNLTNDNGGLVNVFGTPTVSGTFTNSGIVDLTGGPTPLANTLTTGFFKGSDGSTVKMVDDLSAVAGKSDQLNSNTGNSGSTIVDFTRAGGPVVLGGPTHVIINNGAAGSGTLTATATGDGVGAFGLVNVSLQSAGNGNWDLVRSLNVGATGAPVASVMAALSAIDTSFHQSTAPFVASPQSQDPDKWTGGVWSRATTGQTTTKTTAFESFGGLSSPLRVKTDFNAYEVGVDTGILNIGGGGWNGHFGIMAGAVNATANELLSGSGTSVKFDVPFAGVYGVMTHGPFFMDLEARHDWVNTHVTNVPANLNNAELKAHGDSVSGSVGYHFNLPNNWFVEPAAGFGLTQTQFDTLATNLGQTAQGIAAGTISFDSLFSFLVHGGARVGTSFVVADALVLQPFGTLSAWRELGGQSSATFTIGPVADPLSLSRIGTFYQAGIGLSGQLLNTGFIGFVRGDFRWGDNLNGTAVVGGLRYTFGP
jgi:Autotransporter beta-domain